MRIAVENGQTETSGRVVCAPRYLRRNPDFLAVCRMISTQCSRRISTQRRTYIGGQLYGRNQEVTKGLGTFSAQTLKQAVSPNPAIQSFKQGKKSNKTGNRDSIERTFS